MGDKKTIMVVDDEPDNIATVRTILEQNKYKVIAASNGDDCLKKLNKQKVDLVLLDVMMPGTPAGLVAQEIKDTKIAYLTVVRTSDAEKENLMKAGNVVDFIQKPFDIDDFLGRVKKIVGE